jgi:integron integrase
VITQEVAMEGKRWRPAAFRPGEGTTAPAVRVWQHDRLLELAFDRGFSRNDLAIVRAIRGSRWVPQRVSWLLPDTPETIETLRRAFGPRLVVAPARPATGAAPATDPGVEGADPATDAATERATDPATDPATDRSIARNRTGPAPGPRDADALLDAVRRTVRTREYSPRTEAAYVAWVRRFIRFTGAAAERLADLDASHARAFLEHLATAEGLAAGSRNQAASALAFTFREVLGRDDLADVARAKGPKRVPMVLTHREVLRVLRQLTGKYFLIAVLLYSAGLRLDECLRLRVKDIDFELRQILVRDGKGRKDRYVPLAHRAVDLLRAQIARVAELHEKDRAAGHGWVKLPGALHRKDPGAGYELGWQHVFPATTLNEDPATSRFGRWPLHATAVQREFKAAVRRSGIPKRATCHTLRHSFATEALRGGCDIRTLQHVMGHKDLRTTTSYLHVVEQTGLYIRSPLDRPDDPEDYDLDPIGTPWGPAQRHWDLATRQWDAGAKSRKDPHGTSRGQGDEATERQDDRDAD